MWTIYLHRTKSRYRGKIASLLQPQLTRTARISTTATERNTNYTNLSYAENRMCACPYACMCKGVGEAGMFCTNAIQLYMVDRPWSYVRLLLILSPVRSLTVFWFWFIKMFMLNLTTWFQTFFFNLPSRANWKHRHFKDAVWTLALESEHTQPRKCHFGIPLL